jgi:hypothetical protein
MIYIPSENFVSKNVEVTLEEEWCKIKPKEPPAYLFFLFNSCWVEVISVNCAWDEPAAEIAMCNAEHDGWAASARGDATAAASEPWPAAAGGHNRE